VLSVVESPAAAAPATGRRASPQPAAPRSADPRLLARAGFALIGLAIAALLAVAAAGPSAVAARLPAAGGWPPYRLQLNLPDAVATGLGWAAVLVGGAGVLAGLAAVRRGWRPHSWWLLPVVSALVVVGMVVTLPVGSNDLLYYAVYGRIAALGHSPYLVTPASFRAIGDPVAMALPAGWLHAASVYGPLATVAEKAAALLAGPSIAKTVFWLKVWDGLAFSTVAAVLDRALRHDAAARARAHLLWTVNPLMLLTCVAGGHVDVLAVAAGLAGLLLLRRPRAEDEPGAGGLVAAALAAGILVGVATAIKAPFALYGLAAGWAAWRVRGALALAAVTAGAAAVLVPCYLVAGRPALIDLFDKAAGSVSVPLQVLALAASVLLAVVLLRCLPPGQATLPAIRPALALSFAWLATSPQQRPWFDAMIFPLLALMPATRFDWLVQCRAVAAALGELPGAVVAARLTPGWLAATSHLASTYVRPAGMAAVTVAAALSGLLGLRQHGRFSEPPRLQSSQATGSMPLAPGSNPFVRRITTKPEGDPWACEGRSSSGSRAGVHGTARQQYLAGSRSSQRPSSVGSSSVLPAPSNMTQDRRVAASRS
jgi:hypothetical protein